MLYGVKVIHIHEVGTAKKRIYEELILTVNASSFEDAYEKAERYMQDAVCEYTNVNGETVKTVNIEAVDCFLAFDPENDVQEVYSAFSVNKTALSEEDYYDVIASACDENDMRALRNIEFSEPADGGSSCPRR